MKHTHPLLSALLLSFTVLFAPLAIAGDDPIEPATDYSTPETVEVEDAVAVVGQATQKVNINQADHDQLMTLPGIGKVKATAIIDYRQNVGLFTVAEDIQNIKGIGPKLFARLVNKIII